MKRILKTVSKSAFFAKFISVILYSYILLLKLTCRVEHEFTGQMDFENINSSKKTSFALWHQNIILSVITLSRSEISFKDFNLLISPHSDARFLIFITKWIGYGVVEGSTNRNSYKSVKDIFKILDRDGNIGITPDGPKGPACNINSSISQIIYKKNGRIIPVNFKTNSCFRLNSWDKLIVPLPFSKIYANFNEPISLTGNEDKDNILLKNKLNKYQDIE